MRIDYEGFQGPERAECGPTLLACSTAEHMNLIFNGENTITCTYTGPLALGADMSCYLVPD
jgi:hypothetical protein